MLHDIRPDIVAISNENDKKFAATIEALQCGSDAIVDKPLCLTLPEQAELERFLAAHPQRRLLNLLTLRGEPTYLELRRQIQNGALGAPAFVHVRMSVRLKRAQRPRWFLDVRRSGGLFLDLLIHGLDQVEWLTGRRIVALTANSGNLSDPSDPHLRDHAAVYCELDNGASAVVEGQRLLPDTKGSDYRVTVAGTGGVADLVFDPPSLRLTNAAAADAAITAFPIKQSVVADWVNGGDLVPQDASLRANRLALLATLSAEQRRRIEVQP
ncbi:MAG: Gfo/Idh/MocA family oxidoreductase [Acidobacteria bacterium]|nr:Gfo/Idh/MocA family oxidoreductase [Acidobacteriota bacterium]